MKKLIFLLPLIILTAMLCGCYGDLLLLEDGTPADITVDELLRKMDRATDPHKVYANIKSYYMKQVLMNDNKNGRGESVSEIYWKKPGYMKQISSRNGEVINIIISKDGKYWYVNPKNKKSREIRGKDALLVKTFTDIATPGLDYKKIFHTVEIDQILDPEHGINGNRNVLSIACGSFFQLPDISVITSQTGIIFHDFLNRIRPAEMQSGLSDIVINFT